MKTLVLAALLLLPIAGLGVAHGGSGGCIFANGVLCGANGGFFSGATPAVVKLLDNFVGTNGTLLQAHTMDTGPGWNQQLPQMQIQGNKAVASLGQTDAFYTSDAGVTTGTVTAGVNVDLTDVQVNLYAGGINSAAFIVLCYPSTNQIQLFQAGLLAAVPYTFSAGAQTWKAVLTATTFTFFVNGVQKVQATGITPTANTNWGIELYHPAGTPGSAWTQFQVTTP